MPGRGGVYLVVKIVLILCVLLVHRGGAISDEQYERVILVADTSMVKGQYRTHLVVEHRFNFTAADLVYPSEWFLTAELFPSGFATTPTLQYVTTTLGKNIATPNPQCNSGPVNCPSCNGALCSDTVGWYTCFVNMNVTSAIDRKNNTLHVFSRTFNYLIPYCYPNDDGVYIPSSGNSSIPTFSMRYTLTQNHGQPTLSPTQGPTPYTFQDEVFFIGTYFYAHNGPYYVIAMSFMFAAALGVALTVAVSEMSKNSNQSHKLSTGLTCLDLGLIGSSIAADAFLAVPFLASSTSENNNVPMYLGGLIVAGRCVSGVFGVIFVISLFLPRSSSVRLLDHERFVSNTSIYSCILFFMIGDQQAARYLPWKTSAFWNYSHGYPTLFFLCSCFYVRFAFLLAIFCFEMYYLSRLVGVSTAGTLKPVASSYLIFLYFNAAITFANLAIDMALITYRTCISSKSKNSKTHPDYFEEAASLGEGGSGLASGAADRRSEFEVGNPLTLMLQQRNPIHASIDDSKAPLHPSFEEKRLLAVHDSLQLKLEEFVDEGVSSLEEKIVSAIREVPFPFFQKFLVPSSDPDERKSDEESLEMTAMFTRPSAFDEAHPSAGRAAVEDGDDDPEVSGEAQI